MKLFPRRPKKDSPVRDLGSVKTETKGAHANGMDRWTFGRIIEN